MIPPSDGARGVLPGVIYEQPIEEEGGVFSYPGCCDHVPQSTLDESKARSGDLWGASMEAK